MAGKCKLCFSPFREQVEARLLKGETATSLSEWLKTQGELIAHPSIQRHKKNHLAATMTESGFLGATDTLKNTENTTTGKIEAFIDTDGAITKIMSELEHTDVFENVINERKFTQLLLEKIMQKQLIIVHELQGQYAEGKAGYPDSQIRGLKTISDITNTLPTYKSDKLLREIKNDNENNYVSKIVKNATDLGESENAKYEQWYVLKTIPSVPPPYEKIREYAKKIHTGNDGLDGFHREEWEKETVKKWEVAFYCELQDEYDYEEQIRRVIDHYTDPLYGELSEDEREKLDKRIVKKIIENYETPEIAIDDVKGLNDLIRRELPTTEFAP
jgi:hypothetical protein